MLFPLCVPPPTSVCPSSSFVTMTPSPSRESLLAIFPVGISVWEKVSFPGLGPSCAWPQPLSTSHSPADTPGPPLAQPAPPVPTLPPGLSCLLSVPSGGGPRSPLVLGTGAGVSRDPSAPSSPGDAGCRSLPELSSATGCPTTQSSV